MRETICLALTGILIATTALAQAPIVGAAGGKIAGIEGAPAGTTVDIKNGQALTTAAVGDTVYVGDHILTPTNLSVSVSLIDDSEIVIGPDSDFMIKQTGTETEPTTHLAMLYGMLHAVVKKVYTDEHPFLVETPTSVMGVRGTEFVVEHDKAGGESTVHTLEGNVAMGKSRADFRSPTTHSVVTAGSMTSMKKGMTLPPAAKPFQRQALFQRLSQRAPNFVKHVEARRVIRQQTSRPQPKQQPQTKQPNPASPTAVATKPTVAAKLSAHSANRPQRRPNPGKKKNAKPGPKKKPGARKKDLK